MIARAAFRSSRLLGAPFRTTTPLRSSISSQAPRNNESQLYAILGALATGTVVAAVYFGQQSDLKSSTAKLEARPSLMQSSTSALCETIIPEVNLPAELHEQFNKYNKPQSEW